MRGLTVADYYPILARAVAGFPPKDAVARRDLYARARTIVIEQLRERGLQDTAPEAIREQAALDAAIRKVEAESRPVQTRTNGKPPTPSPLAQRATIGDAPDGVKDTARTLSKILQAVQPDDTTETVPRQPDRKRINAVPVAMPSGQSRAGAGRIATADLGGAFGSLRTLLFATAYIVAALAFIGVTYIRCLVWLYQGVIGYPILLAVMTVTLGLFIGPPVMIYRKTATWANPGFLSRLIYPALRRAP
jgi:hypothetical protein